VTLKALIDALKAKGATLALTHNSVVVQHSQNVSEGLLVGLKWHRAALRMMITYGALCPATMTLHEDAAWRDGEEQEDEGRHGAS
jgi:hypothetical protein